MVSNLHEIFTIGHSTRTIEAFVDLLNAHGIQKLIDVRTIPKSRHCPQFNAEELEQSLKEAKIAYRHMKELGGLRHPIKESPNQGWINAGFRGFADYMQTPSFAKALERLEKIAQKKRTAIMCAEAVPWRCHRSLIADALTVRHWRVFHIQSKKTAKVHELTAFLKIHEGTLTYPPIV